MDSHEPDSPEPEPSDRPQPPDDLPVDPDLTYAPGRTQLIAALDPSWSERARKPEPADEKEPIPSGFELDRMIARGGFGEVWSGRQNSLQRIVAVKKIRPDRWQQADPELRSKLLRMFREEALVAARLEHPNIVPVHDLSLDDDGRPLLGMKLVGGRPWIDLLRAESDDPPEDFLPRHLRILIEVCQAVAFAHSKGIVHRDLKPNQVIVGEFGEVLLMDWGLASTFERPPDEADPPTTGEPPEETGSSQWPEGTPSFMSPEQARGEFQRFGPRTDLFLLGGCLFYVLTGTPPYPQKTSVSAFLAALDCTIEEPRDRAPHRHVPPELNELALDLLRARPERRCPQTVQELIERLEAYLTGAGRRQRSRELTAKVAELDVDSADYDELEDALESLDRSAQLWPENGRLDDLRNQVLARFAERALEQEDLVLARLRATALPQGSDRDRLLQHIERDQVRRDHLTKQRRRALQVAAVLACLLLTGGLAYLVQQKEAAEQLRVQRDAAREARGEAEDLMSFLLEDLWTGLVPIDRLDLLEPVANRAADYYQRRDPSELTRDERARRADALTTIAHALSLQGDLEGSVDANRAASAEYASLLDESPNDQELLHRLSDSRIATAAMLRDAGDHESAEDAFEVAGEAVRRLGRRADDADAREQQARLADERGVLEYDQNRLRAAEISFRSAVEELDPLANSNSEEYGAALSGALLRLAVVLNDRGKGEQALPVIRRALTLSAQDGEGGGTAADTAFLVQVESEILSNLGRHQEAAELLRPWSERLRRHIEEDPQHVERRYTKSLVELQLGLAERDLGNEDAARAAWERAVETAEPMRDTSDQLYLLDALVRALELLDRDDEALPIARRLCADGWSHRDFQRYCEEWNLPTGVSAKLLVR